MKFNISDKIYYLIIAFLCVLISGYLLIMDNIETFDKTKEEYKYKIVYKEGSIFNTEVYYTNDYKTEDGLIYFTDEYNHEITISLENVTISNPLEKTDK